MAITQAAYETALEAINTALASDNFLSARKELVKARVIAAGLPDYSTDNRSITRKEAFKALAEIEKAIQLHQDAVAGFLDTYTGTRFAFAKTCFSGRQGGG